MPWGYSKDETLPSLSNKSFEYRKIFSEVANSALNRGLSEDEAITSGINAAEANERKKINTLKKDVTLKTEKQVPLHLKVLKEAKINKDILVRKEEEKKDFELKEKIKSVIEEEINNGVLKEINEIVNQSIVDMQVLDEYVYLVYKNGKKVRRRLADYIVNKQVYVTAGNQGGEPLFTNQNPSLGVGGIEAGSSFENVPVTEMWQKLLYPFTLALAVSPSVLELGTIVNQVTLSWSSSEPDATLVLNQNIGDVSGTTSYVYQNQISSNTTFTLTATSQDATRVANATVSFKNKVITGTTPNLIPTDIELLSSSGVLSDNYFRSVVYDCSGGRRFYIAYPSRYGAMTGATVNNFPWNDWTQTVKNWTNSSGYSEEYILLVSNNIVYGSNIPVVWGV